MRKMKKPVHSSPPNRRHQSKTPVLWERIAVVVVLLGFLLVNPAFATRQTENQSTQDSLPKTLSFDAGSHRYNLVTFPNPSGTFVKQTVTLDVEVTDIAAVESDGAGSGKTCDQYGLRLRIGTYGTEGAPLITQTASNNTQPSAVRGRVTVELNSARLDNVVQAWTYTTLDSSATVCSGQAGSITVYSASRTVTVDDDTTPPTISSVTVESVSTNSATITWTTDEPATAQVEYGTTSSYGSTSALVSSLGTSQSVTLTGLRGNTLYHFRGLSEDAAGNLSRGSDDTFTTTSTPTSDFSALIPIIELLLDDD